MFTYIKMKNFMSFKDATVDFRKNRKSVKSFISIYGENGSGKSNFVISIDLLRRSIESFKMVGNSDKIIEFAKKEELPQGLLEIILGSTDILKYKDDCRMFECDEATTLEYGFSINGHEGYYVMSFKDRFLYEKLYYFTGKQSGRIFEIEYINGQPKVEFSNKLFKNRKVEIEIRDEISKFWGKHTFLSILNKERNEKNEEYIGENYLEYVFDLIDMLKDTSIHCKKTSNSGMEVTSQKPRNILRDLSYGVIDAAQEEILNCSERIICNFFTQTYADIKDVFYVKNTENKMLSYKLYLKKMIGGKVRTVPFDRESAGTQKILEIIRSLFGAFCGVTVVFDEIDDGIHDILLKNVIESMLDYITGQLIITTHNTYMLETVDIKSVYVINIDYQGNKEIRCLDEYPRIQGSNNPRNMYLKGLFGGVPIVDGVDYDEIIQELESNLSVRGGE